MKNDSSAVLACTGAVIGAGFASGREIIVFFSRYGKAAGWLVGLAAVTMAVLCWLCMHAAVLSEGSSWCETPSNGVVTQVCCMLLMLMTAGAMVSAAGHIAALAWHHERAYAIGAVGTLLAAWWMGFGSLKPLHLLSAVLTMMLLCTMLAALGIRSPQMTMIGGTEVSFGTLAEAAIRAVGYAALNMTLAIGVVWKNAHKTKQIGKTSILFGWLIGMLLMIGHCVYSWHPEVHASEFPMVALLAGYGRKGYLFSVVLLYLAVITTLTSVLYAIRTAVEARTNDWPFQILVCLGLPMTVSCFGFTGIVERLYAPAGLACLFLVFVPMKRKHRQNTVKTTFS